MPELRWILILLGVLLVAAVYFIGRRRQNPPAERLEPRLTDDADEVELRRPPVTAHTEPLAEDEGWPDEDLRDDDIFDEPLEMEPPAGNGRLEEEAVPPPVSAAPDEQKIIAVRVAARSSMRFRGEDVVRLLAEEGLEFGKYDIFHRTAEAGPDPVFSVASMVEPGTFEPDAVDFEPLPGVTLFMVLPGPCDGIAALDDMLGTATRLADHLNGEVLDQSGSTLSRQRASNLRDEIIEFQHHLAVLQRHTPTDKGRRRFF